MLDVVSKSRFETFAAIVEHKPKSLYELAKVLDKDQSQVLRDTRLLEGQMLQSA
jgi:predicted transcriptional regulator